MDVLGDVIGRDRRSDSTALEAPVVGRSYDYRRFCTTAWKVGNFFRYLGVRAEIGVAIADDPLPEPVVSFYGAALLGGVVRFDPSDAMDEETRALVVPIDRLDDYEVGLSTKPVVYGGRPDDPSVSYFERDVWSENPTEPPDVVGRENELLATDGRTYSHAEVLDAAMNVVEKWNLKNGDEVAVRGSFTHPGVVAAGLVAPLIAGAVVVLPDDDTVCEYAVGEGPEPSIDPDDVF